MGKSTIYSHAHFTAVEISSKKAEGGAPGLQELSGGVVSTFLVTGRFERFSQIHQSFLFKLCADIFIEIG